MPSSRPALATEPTPLRADRLRVLPNREASRGCARLEAREQYDAATIVFEGDAGQPPPRTTLR